VRRASEEYRKRGKWLDCSLTEASPAFTLSAIRLVRSPAGKPFPSPSRRPEGSNPERTSPRDNAPDVFKILTFASSQRRFLTQSIDLGNGVSLNVQGEQYSVNLGATAA
jgi:hypothetical protein